MPVGQAVGKQPEARRGGWVKGWVLGWVPPNKQIYCDSL